MSGIESLDLLLKTLEPTLSEEEYVFCSFEGAVYGDFKELDPICAYHEDEGLTLIIPKGSADQNGIDYESTYKPITLKVHSSLNAVGLTAAVSDKLTQHGISANVIAAYYHDHVFVPSNQAVAALEALRELQQNS